MTELTVMVHVDGEIRPLTKCVWITWAPCGCPCGALTAAFGDEAFATEEQAWREIYATKRERDKYRRLGFRLELMGWDRYRAEIDLAARCPHVKVKSTQPTGEAVAR
jgi:hypothetical protein